MKKCGKKRGHQENISKKFCKNKRFASITAIAAALLAVAIFSSSCSLFAASRLDEYANIAAEKLVEKYPDFMPAPEETYVAAQRSGDEWYAYVFSELDGGLGAEVYYKDGAYTVNFDYEFFQYRVRLISKLNELMPELREINRHVYWLIPPGIKYETLYRGTNNRVSLGIVRESVDIDRQLAIDYEILRYVAELSDEMGIELNGFSATYFEGNIDDAKLTNKDYGFMKPDRFLSSRISTRIALKDLDMVEKGWYTMVFDPIPPEADDPSSEAWRNRISLEDALRSEEDFRDFARSVMR